jgi:hypothetical protein
MIIEDGRCRIVKVAVVEAVAVAVFHSPSHFLPKFLIQIPNDYY